MTFISVIFLLFIFFLYSASLCLFGKWTDAEYHHTERRGIQNVIFYQIDDKEVKGFYPAEKGAVGKRLYNEGKKYRVIYNERKNMVMDKTMLITNIVGLISTLAILVVLIIVMI
jgi:hypothetical protein